jgi:hypothetical protein
VAWDLLLEKYTTLFLQVTVRYSVTPVGVGRELTAEVIEGGEGINSWHYVCRNVSSFSFLSLVD